ncbi:MAG: hypothetical protein BWY31_01433 [Lentisphaerae bacterium ADurb.Bin242]|nr:MAG: hypothetical protein BWY31_01433 [Lentisphaerae bacterium ADurb.Bin242]
MKFLLFFLVLSVAGFCIFLTIHVLPENNNELNLLIQEYQKADSNKNIEKLKKISIQFSELASKAKGYRQKLYIGMQFYLDGQIAEYANDVEKEKSFYTKAYPYLYSKNTAIWDIKLYIARKLSEIYMKEKKYELMDRWLARIDSVLKEMDSLKVDGRNEITAVYHKEKAFILLDSNDISRATREAEISWEIYQKHPQDISRTTLRHLFYLKAKIAMARKEYLAAINYISFALKNWIDEDGLFPSGFYKIFVDAHLKNGTSEEAVQTLNHILTHPLLYKHDRARAEYMSLYYLAQIYQKNEKNALSRKYAEQAMQYSLPVEIRENLKSIFTPQEESYHARH